MTEYCRNDLDDAFKLIDSPDKINAFLSIKNYSYRVRFYQLMFRILTNNKIKKNLNFNYNSALSLLYVGYFNYHNSIDELKLQYQRTQILPRSVFVKYLATDQEELFKVFFQQLQNSSEQIKILKYLYKIDKSLVEKIYLELESQKISSYVLEVLIELLAPLPKDFFELRDRYLSTFEEPSSRDIITRIIFPKTVQTQSYEDAVLLFQVISNKYLEIAKSNSDFHNYSRYMSNLLRSLLDFYPANIIDYLNIVIKVDSHHRFGIINNSLLVFQHGETDFLRSSHIYAISNIYEEVIK